MQTHIVTPKTLKLTVFSVLEAIPPSKFCSPKGRNFPYCNAMFHVWFCYVHLARNAMKDTQYVWSIEKYNIKCTGFLPFSNTPGKSSLLVLHDLTLKRKTTSLSCCTLHIIKYSMSQLYYLMCYHMLNYCVPPPPLLETCTKWHIRKKPWCGLDTKNGPP